MASEDHQQVSPGQRKGCSHFLGAFWEALSFSCSAGHIEGQRSEGRSSPVSLSFFGGGMGEENGTPLQYSCLENPMDGGAWWAVVCRVTKSRTRLSDFTFTFLFHALEKEMATHSSVLAWRIPGTREPGGLPSMGSHRGGHN